MVFSDRGMDYIESEYVSKSKSGVRISFCVGFLIWAFSGLLDYYNRTTTLALAAQIRYLFVSPILLGIFSLTFTRYFNKFYWQIIVLFATTGVIGASILLGITLPEEPGYSGFSGFLALSLIIVWLFSVLRLRPFLAFSFGLAYVLIYSFTTFYTRELSIGFIVSLNFFLISFCLLMLQNSHYFSKVYRNDSLNSKLIENEKQKLIETKNELEKALDVNSKLTAMVSHDVRAPLNSIKGLLNLITLGGDNNKLDVNALLNKLGSSVETTGEFLNEIITWSKTQTKGFAPKYHPVNLFLLVNDVFKLVEPVANGRNIKLLNEVQNEMEIVVDKIMISTVIRNLVVNAIKFTNRGIIKIFANQNDEITEILISDSGFNGFDKNLGKVEENSSLNKSFGFGHVISNEFIQKHGGMLSSIKNSDSGYTYYFTISNKLMPAEAQKQFIL